MDDATDQNPKNPDKARAARARAAALSPMKRQEIARRAADARWGRKLSHATHEGVLQIADLELPVANLANGTRLMISRAFMTALGRPWKGTYKRTGLPNFIDAKNLSPFINKELMDVLEPVEFVNLNGQTVQGYRAVLLPMVCDVYLAARRAGGVLTPGQERVAAQAEILVRGFARIGIISLVDDATGYSKERASTELATILQAFIAKELQPWVYTFPSDFYEEIFRLRGLPVPKDKAKRPQYFGHLTNDIIYDRLAPGVREELKRSVPRAPSGRPKAALHQKLTPDLGHPKLREHLSSVTTIMKLSRGYEDFKAKLNRIHPRFGDNLSLALDFPDEDS
jgi:hypothetical protein